MIANIVIGVAIFGYAGWSLFRYMKKSKKGQCAACAINEHCESSSK